ncbi:MAG: hypothetical protein LBN38_04380, partial [Verrucomicrobiota bacterium]|nr:hypothetical protein [Verrucomicrobiota bacterium]
MEASLPDPITNYNRQIGQSRYRQREEYIIAHHPGFNLDYWRRIIRASGRVERLGRQWGWTPNQIMLTKALLISRMACIFIDHIIRRMEQAGILDHRAEAPDLEWKNQYHHFQLLFLRQHEIPDRFEIVMLIQRLHRYTVAPLFLLSFRQRHWKRLRKIIAPILRPETATLLLQRQPLADYSD